MANFRKDKNIFQNTTKPIIIELIESDDEDEGNLESHQNEAMKQLYDAQSININEDTKEYGTESGKSEGDQAWDIIDDQWYEAAIVEERVENSSDDELLGIPEKEKIDSFGPLQNKGVKESTNFVMEAKKTRTVKDIKYTYQRRERRSKKCHDKVPLGEARMVDTNLFQIAPVNVESAGESRPKMRLAEQFEHVKVEESANEVKEKRKLLDEAEEKPLIEKKRKNSDSNTKIVVDDIKVGAEDEYKVTINKFEDTCEAAVDGTEINKITLGEYTGEKYVPINHRFSPKLLSDLLPDLKRAQKQWITSTGFGQLFHFNYSPVSNLLPIA